MRTGTRWGWGAAVVLLGLFFAYHAREDRRPASDLEGEAVAAGLGAQTNWQVSTSRSATTGDVTVQLATSSRNEIEDAEGTFRPTLVLRCEGRELEVSVVTGRPAKQLPGFEEEHAATIRFGESQARNVRVRSRFETRVLLLEPAADVIREMLRSDLLLFSFTSLSQWLAPQAVEMSFDLAGLRDAVPELEETCAI